MGEPVTLYDSKGKARTVVSPSEAARLLQTGQWSRVANSLEEIPTEEAVHVTAGTTNPTKFSEARKRRK